MCLMESCSGQLLTAHIAVQHIAYNVHIKFVFS